MNSKRGKRRLWGQKEDHPWSLLSYLVTETTKGTNRECSRMIFSTVVIALYHFIDFSPPPPFFNGTRALGCEMDETSKTDNNPSSLVGGHVVDWQCLWSPRCEFTNTFQGSLKAILADEITYGKDQSYWEQNSNFSLYDSFLKALTYSLKDISSSKWTGACPMDLIGSH